MKGLRAVLTVSVSLVLVGLAGAYPPGWKGPKTITKVGTNYTDMAIYPSLTVKGDTVYMIFYTRENSVYNWRFKRSTNNGLTWGDDVLVLGGHQDSGENIPFRYNAIAVNQNKVFVLMAAKKDPAGNSYAIYFSRSTDGGYSWTTPFNIATLPDSVLPLQYPSITCLGDDLLAAWYGGVNAGNVYSRTSSNGGQSWGVAVPVSGSQYYYDPQVLIKPPNKAYCIFDGCPTYNTYEIFYSVSTDLGNNWVSQNVLYGSSGESYPVQYPAAALLSNGDIFVTWQGNDVLGGKLGYYRTCCGLIGTNDQPVSNSLIAVAPWTNQSHQYGPRVAVSTGDSVNVVWVDNQENQSNFQIYYRCGSFNTSGAWYWGDIPKRISEDANWNPPHYDDLNTDIAFLSCSGSRVAVWDGEYDHLHGDYSTQIWYHKKSTDNTPPGAPTGLQVASMPGYLYLYWTPPTPPGDAKGYNVYRADGLPPQPIFNKINSQPCSQPNYYDRTASLSQCYTYKVTALDCAENQGQFSNLAYYWGCTSGDLVASVDVGNPAPSSNTVHRSGYYSWGSTPDSTVDFDPDSLVYHFTGLAPDSFYLLGVEYFENSTARLREQSLHIDGVEVHGASFLPNFPAKMVYLVPRRTYQDGSINVSFVREQGPNALVAQLWLYQAHFPGGGPQSDGVVDLKGAKAMLYDPAPNPASGAVDLQYALAFQGQVFLAIYNMAGQRVRIIGDQEQSPGKYTMSWNRKDDSGNLVPGGVYFCRLNAGGVVLTKRITMLR